ncbi:MAG: S1 RNA-binding domain-containing protein [Fuerstiella sp.]|nr:S1 RNA-binding domain-containing protein [Fuerstiella sp.]
MTTEEHPPQAEAEVPKDTASKETEAATEDATNVVATEKPAAESAEPSTAPAEAVAPAPAAEPASPAPVAAQPSGTDDAPTPAVTVNANPSAPVAATTVAADAATPPVNETTQPEPAAEPAPHAAPTTPDPSAEAPAVPQPESAAPAEETTTAAPGEAGGDVAASAGTDNSAARVREKLSAQSKGKSLGNEDIKTQRPDTPTNTVATDIPDVDELDANLEAEIASALGDEVKAAPEVVPPPVAEAAEPDAVSADPDAPEEIGPGSIVTGTVQQIHGDDVFLNAGLMADVLLSLKHIPEGTKAEVGGTLRVVIESIDGDGLFRARLPEAKTKTGGNWDGLAVGQVVDCQVTGTNKGGLQVTVSSLKAFLPASQVDLGFVANLEQYIGQTMTVQITEVKPKKRNLVVSRRVLLQAERESMQADFWTTLEVGQDFSGTVKTIKKYGAFVNLGPIDGFLHVGEISWSRISHPNEVLNDGQEIQVRILKIDKDKNRISLGMKQLVQNPWQGLGEKYPSERIVPGKVTRIADFGAFIELEPGVEGLVHISELAWRRVGSVAEVLSVGDERDFQVLEVDQKRKRVSLSLKALEKKPESARKESGDDQPRAPRTPNPDLRGGMGGKSGNSLFGNPSDFT